jgi:plastocyanin
MSAARPPRVLGLVVLAAAAWTASATASAQTACITGNCTLAGTPAVCANRAAPRTPIVSMGNGASLVFFPANPKIEPGDCIVWRAANSTHSSSENACTDNSLCDNPPTVDCGWDTANVSSGAATPTSTCYYDPALFPPTSADAFHCRFHGTMLGTLRVTTSIVLIAAKDLATGSVKLAWSGGGVAGDVSYKVARQSGGDPRFPAGSTSTVNPDGGVLGTTFTDAGDLGNPTTRYYLVRNKQTNEP